MRPSKWVSPSGLVHRRRLRFFVGRGERKADPSYVVTLCGRQESLLMGEAPKGAPVTCRVCIKASDTKAHLRH